MIKNGIAETSVEDMEYTIKDLLHECLDALEDGNIEWAEKDYKEAVEMMESLEYQDVYIEDDEIDDLIGRVEDQLP